MSYPSFPPKQTVPADFPQILSAAGVGEREHEYYARWLRIFFECCVKGHLNPASPASLATFMAQLIKKGESVAFRTQARRAVEVYQSSLRPGRPVTPSPAPVPAPNSSSHHSIAPSLPSSTSPNNIPRQQESSHAAALSWDSACAAVSAEIKLRKYSPRTEEAYLHWLHRSRRYPSPASRSSISSRSSPIPTPSQQLSCTDAD